MSRSEEKRIRKDERMRTVRAIVGWMRSIQGSECSWAYAVARHFGLEKWPA